MRPVLSNIYVGNQRATAVVRGPFTDSRCRGFIPPRVGAPYITKLTCVNVCEFAF